MFYSKILIVFLIFLSGCSQNATKPDPLHSLDILAGMKNEKELFLSDIADSIGYVKLETRSDCLLGYGQAIIRNNRIFYQNGEPYAIYVFDISGKFLYKIDHQGKGPGEYVAILGWAVNQDGTRIALMDIGKQELHFYSADGRFIKSLQAKGGISHPSGVTFSPGNDLLVCTTQHSSPNPKYPALLLFSEDLNKRDTLILRDYSWANPALAEFAGVPYSFFHQGDSWSFKERNSDTLYKISRDFVVSPRLILNTGGLGPDFYQAHSADRSANIDLFKLFETRDYLFIHAAWHNKYYPLIYNKLKQELFILPEREGAKRSDRRSIDPVNDLDGLNSKYYYFDWYDNYWIDVLEVSELEPLKDKNGREAGLVSKSKFGKKLLKLAEESNENDNPVIRILYLKK